MAADAALPRDPTTDMRMFWIGAVGIRGDGAIITARNGSVQTTAADCGINGWSFPAAHAENRLAKKLDYDAIVYVARVLKKSGGLGKARPCYDCELALRSRRVRKVYYSINDCEYGVLDLQDGQERVVNRSKG